MEKIYQKTFPADKTPGFTLIELLVVVLIIGILAAVALPQYEIVVWKSRFASYMPIVKHLKDAQEAFYLANGRYAANLEELGVDMPAGTPVTRGPMFGSGSGIKYTHGMIVFANDRFAGVSRGDEANQPFGGYMVAYDNISGRDGNGWKFSPGQRGCHYFSNHREGLMRKICKSWTGGTTRTPYAPNGHPGYSF